MLNLVHGHWVCDGDAGEMEGAGGGGGWDGSRSIISFRWPDSDNHSCIIIWGLGGGGNMWL